MRVNERVLGRRRGQLSAQLLDPHVDGAVAVRHRAAPHRLVDLLALDHAPWTRREHEQHLHLAWSERDARAGDVDLPKLGLGAEEILQLNVCGGGAHKLKLRARAAANVTALRRSGETASGG